ncbi:MAG: glycine--tRNA ligase subunit beta [Alphaproteobacteria bacterium]|nr:glycine--tRNA ligase subunit beta [Alphaproteobacteria bacterium]MBV9370520.1 glycine--tRNA ligase subunit beta [Alphaproteobacteria bacterium]MBV9901421.1 glycine--tRNA ligase subunit beta [Alphaproteobacteria bacterium]
MSDFLLELLSEEIPARMQDKAREDLARLFAAELGKAGLKAEAIETFATPRRLALIARGLPAETEAVREETKGPRASAPPQALEGFLRKTGLTREQLEERDGVLFAVALKPGRATASVLAEAVPAIVRAFPWPKAMRWGAASASPESPRWVRPLHGIVALLGEEIVEFEAAGIRSGAATVGHRFHHSGIITIGSANDYAEKLKACHVVVDQEERRRLIRDGAAALAAEADLALVADEGLVAENAGLTEWPVPLLGRFDPAFLEVPPEVIRLTMRTNQKYFALLRSGEEHLAPHFVCTANIEAGDGGGAIVAGNERVLSARLADAKFFWEQDLKLPLEAQAEKLSQIVFHEKLGTVADKVERVAKLARWLVEQGVVSSSPERGGGPAEPVEGPARSPEQPLHHPAAPAGPTPRAGEDRERLADLAERAARLCKADLVTQMVGEFPELQGIIGGHLARAQGEPDEVADAIRDHYKPVGQGDDVPTAPVTVAVSLADKLDTLALFFAVKLPPSGSKDPFALRRAALGIIALLTHNRLRARLPALLTLPLALGRDLPEVGWRLGEAGIALSIGSAPFQMPDPEIVASAGEAFFRRSLADFFADRLKVQQREAGVRHDLIDAVFALGGEDDLVRLLARVHALQAFVGTSEGADLLAGYKRAANILKREGWGGASRALSSRDEQGIPQTGEEDPLVLVDDPAFADVVAELAHPESQGSRMPSYTPEKEEAELIAALDSAEPRARAAVEAEDFEAAMAALASLRGPVDAFFDKVTVNDADPVRRETRLGLLARMRDAVHQVADFGRIEG